MILDKEEIKGMRILLDTLVGMVGELEPDEEKTVNKMYAFLKEEEEKLD